MAVYSTSKMLAGLINKNQSQQIEAVDSIVAEDQKANELFSAPQLTPDMQNVLSHILGPSASKEYSPMD